MKNKLKKSKRVVITIVPKRIILPQLKAKIKR